MLGRGRILWQGIKDFFSYASEYSERNKSKKTIKRHNQRKQTKRKVDTSNNENRSNKKTNLRTAIDKKEAAIRDGYMGPICSLCGSRAEIKTAQEHRGIEADYCYWVCPTCTNVSVTTKSGSYEESGNLADALTRRFRGEVQRLLLDKRKELGYSDEQLNQWIQNITKVPKDQAWVGRLDKQGLSKIAVESQKEIFNREYGFIFKKIEK